MKNKQQFCIVSFGLVLCIFTLSVMLFNKKSAGFSLEKIRSPFEKSSKWSINELTAFEKEEIQNILSQDFNYLGSGAQSYAFLSSDGKYVLKFFRMKHLIPKKWLKLIPLPGLDKYRFSKINKRIVRQQELFTSYKVAYDELKEETGLVFIHLNKSKDLRQRIKLYDRMRHCYVANLDQYEFILQKKTQLVRDRITAFMQKEMKTEALEVIHQLLSQVVIQCKKGFIDRDSGISHNYGFVDDKVIHFDIGRVIKDDSAKEPAYYQREILRVGRKLENWLSIHYPILLPDLEEIIDAMIDPSFQMGSPSRE